MSLRTALKALLGTAWHVQGDAVVDQMTPATDGTVDASKPIVADANKDITGLRNLTLTGAVAVEAGDSGSNFSAGGKMNSAVTTIGSSGTNTTQTLISYSLPANTLAANGNGILVTAWGRKAGNAAPVTLALAVGGASINTGSDTQSGTSWVLTGRAYRSAANAQQEVFTAIMGATPKASKSTSDTSVDTGAITISVQALDASAAQSNVLLDGFIVEYFP